MGEEELKVTVSDNVFKVVKERAELNKAQTDVLRNDLCNDRARFAAVVAKIEADINKYNTALGYDEDDFDVKE